MKTPPRLQPLLDEGLIDDVLYALMSGKEASVYVVRCGERICCAKVYKDAAQRSFKKAAQYQEGRKERSSRRARAMEKGSGYGRQQAEASWQSAEVDALFKLAAAGVRVPTPYGCYDGVLLMELVRDADGDVAPRLNDISLSAEQARYADELWDLFEAGNLDPNQTLTGVFSKTAAAVDLDAVLQEIQAASDEAAARRERQQHPSD